MTMSEKVLKRLDEQHSKYKFMEYNLLSKRRRAKRNTQNGSLVVVFFHFHDQLTTVLPHCENYTQPMTRRSGLKSYSGVMRLKLQIPELENSLEMIKFLQKQSGLTREIEMQYMLSDQVYVKAVVPPTDKVCLWLGANVMLEYTLADALNLLTNNIQSAKKNLNYVEHDLDFLRDQFTTTEVNMARVYNWDVKRRQAAKASS
uniref:Prefoldin subunit 3 n=1 Tax=Timema bartmani TaxID=61472 RepID=A0A7R9F2L5_9NEOP|nr:unnamed protein product [Timema bartmani]